MTEHFEQWSAELAEHAEHLDDAGQVDGPEWRLDPERLQGALAHALEIRGPEWVADGFAAIERGEAEPGIVVAGAVPVPPEGALTLLPESGAIPERWTGHPWFVVRWAGRDLAHVHPAAIAQDVTS